MGHQRVVMMSNGRVIIQQEAYSRQVELKTSRDHNQPEVPSGHRDNLSPFATSVHSMMRLVGTPCLSSYQLSPSGEFNDIYFRFDTTELGWLPCLGGRADLAPQEQETGGECKAAKNKTATGA
ncbi:hypothetical protein RRG08_058722 [Elysia crispata]|uniref:Uncharacterized protein n=1 Tax=Elysia crispata TaxID=231223 RepID=A0AAE0YWQ6_9GAST|nr:hypothetical protein RRG08_058722 [Elysia crispata]